jgi:hypothetical protein
VIGGRQDVLAPVAQRRHGNREYAEPVVEVGRERPTVDHALEPRVRGGEELVHPVLRGRAERPERAVLEGPQRRDLAARGEGVRFVEE